MKQLTALQAIKFIRTGQHINFYEELGSDDFYKNKRIQHNLSEGVDYKIIETTINEKEYGSDMLSCMYESTRSYTMSEFLANYKDYVFEQVNDNEWKVLKDEKV